MSDERRRAELGLMSIRRPPVDRLQMLSAGRRRRRRRLFALLCRLSGLRAGLFVSTPSRRRLN